MNTNRDVLLSKLLQLMIRYDKGDARRIQHLVKVHDFARMIALAEGMDEEERFVLEAAAILHDVGIHAAEAKYGNCNGKYQEELGPDEARGILAELDGFTHGQIERICWLIAHHHTYSDVTSQDHRILLEADFLVNSYEDNVSREGIKTFREKVFRSDSAIRMLNDMWGLEMVHIETYKPEYKEDFIRLNKEWIESFFKIEASDIETFSHVDEIVDRGGQIFIATTDGGEAVGCCALKHHETDGTYELAKMAVSPRHQGKHIGHLLGAAVIDYAKKHGVSRIFLEGNTRLAASIALYRSLGFKEIPLVGNAYERCDILMEWTSD